MTTLDIKKYGYPIASNYSISTDLALIRTEVQSGWRRQRRSFLHNASLITLSWRLPTNYAKDLNNWLQGQSVGEFFYCDLLTGNNANASCVIEAVPIRRTTSVTTTRVPLTNLFEVSFQAETNYQVGYQTLSSEAADLPPQTYPSNLPIPRSTDFGSSQETRNISVYTLSYKMTTETLANWLAFSGFIGTAWFYSPMVSVSIPCGIELIRFTSAPQQTLIAPNMWEVTITAESQPASSISYYILPPTEECTYDSDITYDESYELYDCGGVTPGQGQFVSPGGQVIIYNSIIAVGTATIEGVIKFLRDGTVITEPLSTPLWTAWHTNPTTLPRPAVASMQVIEFSLDQGATWKFSTFVAGGVWFSLKNQDVWFRLKSTKSVTGRDALAAVFSFEADKLPTPSQFTMSQSVTFANDFTISQPEAAPIFGANFQDISDWDQPVGKLPQVSADVSFLRSGYVNTQEGAYNGNKTIGAWFGQPAAGVGDPYWIIATTVGTPVGVSFPKTGQRFQLNAAVQFKVVGAPDSQDTISTCTWNGTYEIYDAQVGGNLLGNGTINLHAEVTR